MDKQILAHPGHDPRSGVQDRRKCFACYEGVVYIGELVEGDDGEHVEVIECVPCRRCSVGEDL